MIGKTNIIEIENATIFHHYKTILNNVSLRLNKGDFIYIIGKTGSGKSSLLKTLYSDIPLKMGQIIIDGDEINKIKKSQLPYLRRKIGIVFQDFGLLTDRNISNNLEFALRATGWNSKKEIDLRINEVLERVGLTHKGYKFPHELSGGEQQRVSIARALLNSPLLFLADEPTGNLDPETTRDILTLMHGLTDTGCSVIMATHDHASMTEFPGKILICENGEIRSSI